MPWPFGSGQMPWGMHPALQSFMMRNQGWMPPGQQQSNLTNLPILQNASNPTAAWGNAQPNEMALQNANSNASFMRPGDWTPQTNQMALQNANANALFNRGGILGGMGNR